MTIFESANLDIESPSIKVRFVLNEIPFEREVRADWTLLKYLRDELGYRGTKCGCEIGECGACTVLFNGRAVNSCLVMAPQMENSVIWTIEGLTVDDYNVLHPIQKAMVECDAVHCGFCTPGMVMSILGLLLEDKNPDDDRIKAALAGNLCRCTGYRQIIEAVKNAANIIDESDLEKFRFDGRKRI